MLAFNLFSLSDDCLEPKALYSGRQLDYLDVTYNLALYAHNWVIRMLYSPPVYDVNGKVDNCHSYVSNGM